VILNKLTFRADFLHNDQLGLNLRSRLYEYVAAGMTVIDFSDARDRLKSVLDRVNEDVDYTIIVRPDGPDAVVMLVERFNALLETVHLLKFPANAAHLARSIEQYRTGGVQAGQLIRKE